MLWSAQTLIGELVVAADSSGSGTRASVTEGKVTMNGKLFFAK